MLYCRTDNHSTLTHVRTLLDNEFTYNQSAKCYELATGKHLAWTREEANIGAIVRGVRRMRRRERRPRRKWWTRRFLSKRRRRRRRRRSRMGKRRRNGTPEHLNC